MFKDLIISLLAAGLTAQYFTTQGLGQYLAVMLGLTMLYLFFCFFCEEQAEKWQEKQKRKREYQNILERLRTGR